jgi:hypothetical protein
MIYKFLIGLTLIIFVILIYLYSEYREFSAWLNRGEQEVISQKFKDIIEPFNIPPLIKRYISIAVTRPVSGHYVKLTQKGFLKFNADGKAIPFQANQIISLTKSSFSWMARTSKGFLPIVVCDRLINNKGELQARLFASFKVADATGPELLKGELLRYLAEIPWFPLAISCQPSIIWKQLSSKSVSAEIDLEGVKAKVNFYFDKRGLIEKIYVPDRGMIVGSKSIPTPWEGHFSNYKEIKGLLVPTHGEISWILPEGRFTYFKGDLISYDVQ